MKTRIPATLAFTMLLAAPVHAQQPNPFAAARDLYASARYDEALALLNGLRPADGVGPDRKSVEQYRSLCLLALGRGVEAEGAIAAVVMADPLFIPAEADASPRVRAAFSDVRERLLPEIASARYASAKTAYDRKDFPSAERQFRDLASLLRDPQMGTRLGDLKVLTAGFLELAAAAAAPRPEPKKEEAAPAPPPAPAPAPAPEVSTAGRIWNADDADITPPVVIRQDVPKVPASIAKQARERGLLEVVIDEQGRVTTIVLRTALHANYDPVLMAAARDWRYQPATFKGVPVKYRKLIQIVVGSR